MTHGQEVHFVKLVTPASLNWFVSANLVRHLRKYLRPLFPWSRVEIHTTPRYSAVSKHTELAVYATQPLAPGTLLDELQGGVAPVPKEWEMGSSRESQRAGPSSQAVKDVAPDEDSGLAVNINNRRRDFSLVISRDRQCLFLGPARFVNVSLLCFIWSRKLSLHSTTVCPMYD